jgi:hypothetical protein
MTMLIAGPLSKANSETYADNGCLIYLNRSHCLLPGRRPSNADVAVPNGRPRKVIDW